MGVDGQQYLRVALIGNFPPRRCGIATFTSDIYQALKHLPGCSPVVVAMNDGPGYDHPAAVRWTLEEEDAGQYRALAQALQADGVDVLLLQHEFGIFGGPAGEHLLELLEATDIPLVTTLHTVLADPDPHQKRVMDRLVARSETLIVMAERGRRMLMDSHPQAVGKVALIPHGIPDRSFIEPAVKRAELGWEEVPTLLTFGLLSPNKGIETMIDAMPALIDAVPNLRYVVLGATHPNLLRQQGEQYRHSLIERARVQGVEGHIRFEDRFVELPELCDYLQAADVYVTPYRKREQITSGTLAYAHGLGKPIVSTPYWHAEELLAHRPHQLVDFDSAAQLASSIGALMTREPYRKDAAADAYRRGRAHIWSVIGAKYLSLIRGAKVSAEPIRLPPVDSSAGYDSAVA